MAIIKIKRSSTRSEFGSTLQPGELAYSFISQQLYIGNPVVGEQALLIGGNSPVIGEAEINITIG